jgi:hypothetical protein
LFGAEGVVPAGVLPCHNTGLRRIDLEEAHIDP